MASSFRDVLEALVQARIEAGEDPADLVAELSREANIVFGHYNLEYELGLFRRDQGG